MSLFCFLFWHRWRPQAVENVAFYRTTTAHGDGEAPMMRKTRVLLRCTHCSRAKVRTLEGRWTLEQLLLGEEMADPRVGVKQ